MDIELQEDDVEELQALQHEYIPSNLDNQQYFYRIALFMDEFLRKFKNEKNMQNWFPILARTFILRLRRYPRNLALLKLITALVTVMEECKYFDKI